MIDEIKNSYKNLMNTLKSIMPFYDKNTGEAHIGVRHGLYDKDSSFAIIAIRCDDIHCTGRKNLIAGKIYQLLDGYKIEENAITMDQSRVSLNLLYDDYTTENTIGIPHVQFSAILGKNGSGKSSLIELMMRILNNFATRLFGEINSEPAAERLHYIDHLMATLWFSLENKIFQLSVCHQQVVLLQFVKAEEKTDHIVYKLDSNHKMVIGDIVPDSNSALSGIYDKKIIKSIASHFFYTLVSNYSIYAYNTSEFINEGICPRKRDEIKGELSDDFEEDVWLYSLFNKNDGYKVPLGITPYRNKGNIDVNNEKELANERLISLMVRNPDYRTVNRHLEVKGLYMFFIQVDSFGYDRVKSGLNFKELTLNGYKQLSSVIVEKWVEYTGVAFDKKSTKPYFQQAIDYIVYKTLKVSKQYGEHHQFYKLLDIADDFPGEMIDELVKSESDNHSHITRKIFQTIAYLTYDVYDLTTSTKLTGKIYNSFDDILKRWGAKERRLKKDEYTRNKIHIWNSAMFPPPFLNFDLDIHSLENGEIVKFETLSSGERQQLYTISSLLYHLDNLSSIKSDEYDKERIFYPHVTIILEEIELYFHPEMQQNFVKYLLDGIHAINLEHLKSINFILVTHSPYVLSDIPRSNILALNEHSEPVSVSNLRAFGANIHDMLRTSFFLSNGAIGSLAQWEIKHIVACLRIHQWARTPETNYSEYQIIMEDDSYDFMERYTTVNSKDPQCKYFEYSWFDEELGSKQLKEKIDLIDEPVLHHALMRQYSITFGIDSVNKEEKRKRLLQQLKELDEDDIV